MQFYACACISVMLCTMLAQQRGQNVPRGDNCGLSGGRFAQQVTIASAGRLAVYIALTAALAHHAKDKGAFIRLLAFQMYALVHIRNEVET